MNRPNSSPRVAALSPSQPGFGGKLSIIAVALGGGVILAAPPPVHARPTYAPSIVFSAGTGFSRNPYLYHGKGFSTSKVNLEVAPKLEITSDRQTILLDGFYRFTDYTRKHYNTDNAWGGRLAGNRRISSGMAVSANIAYERARVGTFNGSDVSNYIPVIGSGTNLGPTSGGTGSIGNGSNPTGTGTLGPGNPTGGNGTSNNFNPGNGLNSFNPGDVSLVGERRYRTSFNGGISANGRLDARHDWNIGFAAVRSHYSHSTNYGDNNYWLYSPSFGINRKLSANRSVGVQFSTSRVNYSGKLGDSWIYTPQLVARIGFANGWTASGGAGVSVTRRHRSVSGKRSRMNFSGEGSICRGVTRTTFCLGGSHNAGVTGGGGVSEISTLYASYGYKLTERNSIGATIRAYRNGGSNTNLTEGKSYRSRYLSAGLSYEHRLSRRLRLVATAAYADVYRKWQNVRSDVTGQLTLVFDTGIIR